MLWTDDLAEFKNTPAPKHLDAKQRGQYIRHQQAVNDLYASLFPEDEDGNS